LFTKNLDDCHRIYYYHHVRSSKAGYVLVFAIYGGDPATDRLWVLVNEKTGIVEEFAFKKFEKPMVFGRME
jgi:hypothetical protein